MFFNMEWDIAARQVFLGMHLLVFTVDVYQLVLSFRIQTHALMAAGSTTLPSQGRRKRKVNYLPGSPLKNVLERPKPRTPPKHIGRSHALPAGLWPLTSDSDK